MRTPQLYFSHIRVEYGHMFAFARRTCPFVSTDTSAHELQTAFMGICLMHKYTAAIFLCSTASRAACAARLLGKLNAYAKSNAMLTEQQYATHFSCSVCRQQYGRMDGRTRTANAPNREYKAGEKDVKEKQNRCVRAVFARLHSVCSAAQARLG